MSVAVDEATFECPLKALDERLNVAAPGLSATGATRALSHSGKSNEFAAQIRRVQFIAYRDHLARDRIR